jgi:hypothetical protein
MSLQALPYPLGKKTVRKVSARLNHLPWKDSTEEGLCKISHTLGKKTVRKVGHLPDRKTKFSKLSTKLGYLPGEDNI